MEELEVLKILADLIIFLISITIPTYAIAISLLGPEYARAIRRISEEKSKLEKELQETMGRGAVKLEELEKKIQGFRKKEKKMRSRFNPLSLYPTVVLPNIFFVLSLATILICMQNFSYQDFPIYLGGYITLTGIGIVFLGWALIMIQRAAKETVMES